MGCALRGRGLRRAVGGGSVFSRRRRRHGGVGHQRRRRHRRLGHDRRRRHRGLGHDGRRRHRGVGHELRGSGVHASPVETLGSPLSRRSTDSTSAPEDRLSWAALPMPAQLYVAGVMIGGASAFVAFVPRTFPHPALFVVALLAACLTSLWKVNLPIARAGGSTLSVSYAANLMALLLLGPEQALIVALAGVWTQCTYHAKQPYPLYRTLFSVAAEAITMGATGVVYQQLGGSV